MLVNVLEPHARHGHRRAAGDPARSSTRARCACWRWSAMRGCRSFPTCRRQGTGHRSLGAQVPWPGGSQGHAAARWSRRGKRPSPSCSPTRHYKQIYTRNGLQPGFMPHAEYVAFIGEFGSGDARRFSRNPASSSDAQSADAGVRRRRRSRVSVGYYCAGARHPEQPAGRRGGPRGLPIVYAVVLAGLALVADRARALRPAVRATDDRRASASRSAQPRVAGMLAHRRRATSSLRAVARLLPSRSPCCSRATAYLPGRRLNRRVVLVAVAGAVFFWVLFVVAARHPAAAGIWPPL